MRFDLGIEPNLIYVGRRRKGDLGYFHLFLSKYKKLTLTRYVNCSSLHVKGKLQLQTNLGMFIIIFQRRVILIFNMININ
jgi:hypothetical protein